MANAAMPPVVPTALSNRSAPNWPPHVGDGTLNCAEEAAARMIELWTAVTNAPATISEDIVQSVYGTLTDGTGGTPSNILLPYWSGTGIGGHKIDATQWQISKSNKNAIEACIYLFGGCYLVLDLPDYAPSLFSAGKPWDVQDDSAANIAGTTLMHAVPAYGYDSEYLRVMTWGKPQFMSWAFCDFCSEVWCLLSPDWIRADGKTPTGLDYATLADFMTRLEDLYPPGN